ncbi:M15 family metallopeptidase [Streptomyces sp. NPDC057027]|uniref:M15 family metallopeptidase n=1 Tax=Streptomyces sp. NPDC057027 TaxID=3346004 RepID=UPI00363FBB2A
MPVIESGERLVDVRLGGRLLVDTRKQDPADAFAHLREGVLERLLTAQTMLPVGIRLLFVEGYRPPSLQREYLRSTPASCEPPAPAGPPMRSTRWRAGTCHPPRHRAAQRRRGRRPHLVDADGHELDLGTRMNADPEESAGACYTHAPYISEEARANRKLLGTVLTAAGLVNYPTQWWHWSFGDRYWALLTGKAAALYGPKELGSRS